MLQGIYHGPVGHLRGKRALLERRDSQVAVYAQFDDSTLTLENVECRDPTRLGYGWHAFPVGDFAVLLPVRWDED